MKTMRKKQNKAIRRIPHSLLPTPYSLLLLLLLSCRSAPTVPDTLLDETGFIALEPGAAAYFIADVRNARPILDQLDMDMMNNRQIRQMLDMTQSAIAAVYAPEGGAPHGFRLMAWGGYPSFRARTGLRFSRDWKRQRSAITGSNYWFSATSRLSVALEPRQIFVSTAPGTEPVDPIAVRQRTAVPEEFRWFQPGAVLAGWFDSPSTIINRQLEELGIPITIPVDTLFIGLFPLDEQQHTVDEQRYTVNVRLEFNEVGHALALMGGISILRRMELELGSGSSSVLAAILLSNPPVRNVRTITLKSNAMSSSEIALLFSMFSL